jgi:hypothetical protein
MNHSTNALMSGISFNSSSLEKKGFLGAFALDAARFFLICFCFVKTSGIGHVKIEKDFVLPFRIKLINTGWWFK